MGSRLARFTVGCKYPSALQARVRSRTFQRPAGAAPNLCALVEIESRQEYRFGFGFCARLSVLQKKCCVLSRISNLHANNRLPALHAFTSAHAHVLWSVNAPHCTSQRCFDSSPRRDNEKERKTRIILFHLGLLLPTLSAKMQLFCPPSLPLIAHHHQCGCTCCTPVGGDV